MARKKMTDEEKATALETKMRDLADGIDMTFDGGDDDRIFDDEQATVFVNLMSREDYDELVTELQDYEVKGKGFRVSAWNDSSSYDYWKTQGEAGDANYIQVTAYVDPKKINQINPDVLREAIREVRSHYAHYDNCDEYYAKLERDKRRNNGKVIRVA